MNSSILRFALGFLCLLAVFPAESAEALWKAGVAKANITPAEPIWLAGFGSRTKPAEGKATDLWIKVLALEDAQGHRAVMVTSDLLGIPRSLYNNITGALKEKFGLQPEQILLSSSHTHCGPVIRGAVYDMYPLNDQQRAVIEKYSTHMESEIVDAVGRALADLSPARLSSGQGTTGFAVNRRNNPEKSVPQLIADGALKGPVDHDVPVLAVFQTNGNLKATLFGYACHNTTMDFQKYCGDYAGFAQIALEKSHPEATAMFFMGCGGDQNPLPRHGLHEAERYGNMLAAAVEEVLLAPPRTLPAQLKTAMEMTTLNLGPEPTEAELEAMKSARSFIDRGWAAHMLADKKAGKPLARTYAYPIQAWLFGGKQMLISLGGEAVVDYSLKFKKTYGARTWVASYCNDVMAYIPSLRVLKEGGYEGGGSMTADGMPARRWGDDVEDLITAGVDRQIARVQTK